MARITVDSDELLGQVQLLDFINAILEQCTDEDDLDVVEGCTDDIRKATGNLRQIIKKAEPAKMIDSTSLGAIADNIENHCNSLGYLDDNDPIEDVYYYVNQIRFEVCGIRKLIEDAEPAKENKHGTAADELRELSRFMMEEIITLEGNGLKLTPLRKIVTRLTEMAEELKPDDKKR